MEHPEEDESPFDLSEDGPPALSMRLVNERGGGEGSYR